MKQLLLSLSIVLSAAFANAQSTAIEANWGMQMNVGPMSFDMTFAISKNSITVTNVCTGYGQTLTAQVTAQSTYTENTFTVLESKQDQKSIANLDCNVSTMPDTTNYTVQGDKLILTHTGSPETLVLIRK